MWAERTGGSLTFADRLQLITQGLVAQLEGGWARRMRKLGLGSSRQVRLGVQEIHVPDTATAHAAADLCASVSPAFLVNHCLRTYAWGVLLGARDGVSYDPELLYVACLLHDLGLTERFSGAMTGVNCFAVEGAYAAVRLLEERGWSRERRTAVAEAISLHLNIRVGMGQGPEAHLLHEGAALDVIGARYRQVSPEARQAVVERHPRLAFKTCLPELFLKQVHVRPGSRANFLERTVGFSRRIIASPFVE